MCGWLKLAVESYGGFGISQVGFGDLGKSEFKNLKLGGKKRKLGCP